MNDSPHDPLPPAGPPAAEPGTGAFAATRWTLIQSVAGTDPHGAAAAMEQLCRIYWYPIYAFIRRTRGYRHHDAQDLTQAFFAHLLTHETLTRARQERGRFRNFLLAVLCKVLANEKDAREALKRGGAGRLSPSTQ
ncbi:MAG: hypothetical protein NTW21_40800 [Verrucomicrobia bacterium]|nr:hypothetical protein [Verrucomicrobiota bacterium]